MSILKEIIEGLIIGITTVTGVVSTYQTLVSCGGLFRRKEEVANKPQKTFAVLIAAHNESAVIAPLIENLKKLDYPKEMYDIFVICDNCTDNTAEIARQHGAIACERFDNTKRGKGFGIEWMLENLWSMPKQYDAVVMFDADNLVDKNFLLVMNDRLCKGARVIQAYLDSKNPFDSWITLSYAVTYWFTNRMWQLARHNLGLPNTLGGTGLCIESKLLKEMGWGATSLTEDLEFATRCIERGIYPTWAHDTKVYDEKPIDLKSSMRQRLRWMQGHYDVAGRYIGSVSKNGLKQMKLGMLDAAFYLFQPMYVLIVTFMSILFAGRFFDIEWLTPSVQPLPDWFVFTTTGLFYLLPFLALYLDKVPLKGYIGLIFLPFFFLTWLPIFFYAFFTKKNQVWSHTVHSRAIRIEEIQQ
ncbi:glycosyltransferase family 2 protein [Brevibacillus fulvus]|uniref:Cellulose synthase/poly-beta-1,6-N-acetylglucosamine synthase-like glycosyltransferase n=1 Tax=Brevibacillus fulvus TaxID=1125967 RepID=A0A938XZL5_9BACL|nr:glycosyltransferase family 2 protein [Brevibacillus fulvus]MBM7588415.1 cellulose synthase/poly-beta-1,6-N-acetylglucosamine synthase-like glycosyltransferase [Brevibacillus fulvus]